MSNMSKEQAVIQQQLLEKAVKLPQLCVPMMLYTHIRLRLLLRRIFLYSAAMVVVTYLL